MAVLLKKDVENEEEFNALLDEWLAKVGTYEIFRKKVVRGKIDIPEWYPCTVEVIGVPSGGVVHLNIWCFEIYYRDGVSYAKEAIQTLAKKEIRKVKQQ